MNKVLQLPALVFALASLLAAAGNACAQSGMQTLTINVPIQLKDLPTGINATGAACYVGPAGGDPTDASNIAKGYTPVPISNPNGSVSAAVTISIPLDKLSQVKRWSCQVLAYQGGTQYLIGTAPWNNLFRPESVVSISGSF